MKLGNVFRVIALAMVLSSSLIKGAAGAVAVDLGDFDLRNLQSSPPDLVTEPVLVRWRTGKAGDVPVPTNVFSFQYLTSGTKLPLPSRLNPSDGTANDAAMMWSDNAIEFRYKRGTSWNSQILVYSGEPEGGLRNDSRSVFLPLLWKAVSRQALIQAADADVRTKPLPLDSPLRMPSVVTVPTGGVCVENTPYKASVRTNAGFCDYSTHWMLGIGGPRWYERFSGQERVNAFNYSSVVGPNGANTSEAGIGTGTFDWVDILLGVDFYSATREKFTNTIVVEVRSI